MHIITRQPIRFSDHDDIEFCQRRMIAQTIQSGTIKLDSAVAIIALDVFRLQHPPLGFNVGLQALQLLRDRLRLSLPIRLLVRR